MLGHSTDFYPCCSGQDHVTAGTLQRSPERAKMLEMLKGGKNLYILACLCMSPCLVPFQPTENEGFAEVWSHNIFSKNRTPLKTVIILSRDEAEQKKKTLNSGVVLPI